MQIPDNKTYILYSLEWSIESLIRRFKNAEGPLSINELDNLASSWEKLLTPYSALLTQSSRNPEPEDRRADILDILRSL